MKYLFLTIIFVLPVCIAANGQEIKFIKDYNNIISTSQLFAQLKGKTFFLDIWAPWCDPCKEEFKYSDTLYSELKKRHIAILYLSLHTRVDTAEWKAAVSHYRLKGLHVLANKVLEDSITTFIWGFPGGFSIPRYLLIGPNEKVLLKDAISPDHGPGLYRQIDSAIRKTY